MRLKNFSCVSPRGGAKLGFSAHNSTVYPPRNPTHPYPRRHPEPHLHPSCRHHIRLHPESSPSARYVPFSLPVFHSPLLPQGSLHATDFFSIAHSTLLLPFGRSAMDGHGGGYHDYFSQGSSPSFQPPRGPTPPDEEDVGFFSQQPWHARSFLEQLDLNSRAGGSYSNDGYGDRHGFQPTPAGYGDPPVFRGSPPPAPRGRSCPGRFQAPRALHVGGRSGAGGSPLSRGRGRRARRPTTGVVQGEPSRLNVGSGPDYAADEMPVVRNFYFFRP